MISFTVLLQRLNEMMEVERINKVQAMTVRGLAVTFLMSHICEQAGDEGHSLILLSLGHYTYGLGSLSLKK